MTTQDRIEEEWQRLAARDRECKCGEPLEDDRETCASCVADDYEAECMALDEEPGE